MSQPARRAFTAVLAANQRHRYVGYLAALAAVVLDSLFIGLVLGQVSLANISMLYLLAVLATAVAFGRGPAVFASLSAFLIFDWFFVQPLHQFTVSDPEEWISLLFFLLTAIVTGQLAAGQRQRAQEAREREREAVVLYDVVRILGEGELQTALSAVAERLRQELELRALAIQLWNPGGTRIDISAGDTDTLSGVETSATRIMQTSRSATETAHAVPGRWVRIVAPRRSTGQSARDDVHLVPIRVGDRRVGALVLVDAAAPFQPTEDRLISAAATQIGVAFERARLRDEATEAEILRRTDQLRAALLNAVSHDLRTPLATIMASAGSLRQQDVTWTEDERLGFAQAIEEEAARLNRLVSNLLDLSRIEAGSLRPQKSWQDLEVLVEDVVGRLRATAVDHPLRVDIPRGMPPLWLDPVEIGQVIYNLVENATKYSPAGTPIELVVRAEPRQVTLSVSDRGPGIATTALPHLFDPFYRAADNRPRADGLGLGLAIVKGLVEAHGGRVWAENRAGGGARFTFTLPLADVPVAVEA